jgi:hypothetical protein
MLLGALGLSKGASSSSSPDSGVSVLTTPTASNDSGAAVVYKLDATERRLLFYSCTAFCCVLAAYFCLLPVREEAAISIGKKQLPALFTASLCATVCDKC